MTNSSTRRTPATGGASNSMPNGRLLTGALVGGVVTYLLTNEAAQRTIISGVARVWLGLKGGLEETKERFRDAESEIKAQRAE